MTERTEIRITGFGGQGVVLSGHIIGRAVIDHFIGKDLIDRRAPDVAM